MPIKKFGSPEKINPMKQKEDYTYIEVDEKGKKKKEKINLGELLRKLIKKQ